MGGAVADAVAGAVAGGAVAGTVAGVGTGATVGRAVAAGATVAAGRGCGVTGRSVGASVGATVGRTGSRSVGAAAGAGIGADVATAVGILVEASAGYTRGVCVGTIVAADVGSTLGPGVAASVGCGVAGSCVGSGVIGGVRATMRWAAAGASGTIFASSGRRFVACAGRSRLARRCGAFDLPTRGTTRAASGRAVRRLAAGFAREVWGEKEAAARGVRWAAAGTSLVVELRTRGRSCVIATVSPTRSDAVPPDGASARITKKAPTMRWTASESRYAAT